MHKSHLYYLAKDCNACCEFGLLSEYQGMTEEAIATALKVSSRTVSNWKRKVRDGRLCCEHPGNSSCIRTR